MAKGKRPRAIRSLGADDFSEVMWDLLLQAGSDIDQLERIFRSAPREAIEEYYREFRRAMYNLSAVTLQPEWGNHSEDTQFEILCFIVGQGKEFYSEILAHPDRAPIREHLNAPGFLGAASVVYWDRFKAEIPAER